VVCGGGCQSFLWQPLSHTTHHHLIKDDFSKNNKKYMPLKGGGNEWYVFFPNTIRACMIIDTLNYIKGLNSFLNTSIAYRILLTISITVASASCL